MADLNQKIAVITGGTRGIGRGIALRFASAGAVAVIIGRDEAKGKTVVDEISSQSHQADFFPCDVKNWTQVQETVNKILDKYKRIDILVNNAGMTRDNLLLRLSDEDWDAVIETNLKGAFHFTKAVGKAMLKARNGKIINIASIIGITGNAGQANYAASKAGLIGFTKSLAREFASRGITANAIAPGYIETEMTGQLNDKVRENILQSIPMGRFGRADDVADVCLFLASPRADYITGQTFVVDGGLAI